MSAALSALTGLSQETRLRVFRILVQRGPKGLPAGKIGERLDLPPATLSFHLAHLENCGLVSSRREGRMIIYTADYAVMDSLMAYLTEHCCTGGDDASCASFVRSLPPSKKSRISKESSS